MYKETLRQVWAEIDMSAFDHNVKQIKAQMQCPQMIGVIIMILGLAVPSKEAILQIGSLIFFASIIMTIYSGCEYIYKNRDVFSM